MAKVSLFQIKQWFRKFQFPTQEQFWDTWDSFWHKDEQIPASQIDGLQQIFDAATSGFADELAEKQDKTDNSLDTENKTIAGAINELNHLIPQPKYVEINGVKWAKCNVDMPGTFAETPESAGMFYQINRNVGWSSTEPVVNSDGGTTWDSANPGEFVWEKANDPSPDGFRVPSTQEIEALLDTAKVAMANVTQNGVYGNRFTDIQTGNSIFIPAAGYRDSSGELYGAGESGNYAGGTAYSSGIATFILQDEDVWLDYGYNASGWSIRPVFAPQEDNKKFYTVEGVYELNSENILEKILLTRANQIAGVSQQIDAGSLILVNGLLARITEIWEATNYGVTNLYGAAELVSNIRGEEIILAENPFDAANIANERLNKPTVIFLELHLSQELLH